MSDYSFIKEVIKEKPINKKVLLLKLASLLIGAVLFGVLAAWVFATMLPVFEKRAAERQSDKVNIETETPPEETADSTVTETEERTEITASPQVVEVPAELELSDYKQFYTDMVTASEKASKAMVTVIGITDNMDWFNNTYENQRQVSGLIVARTGQEIFIVTEYRGVEKVDRIHITFFDKTTVDARFQKSDPNTGLAVLKVPLSEIESDTLQGLRTAPWGSSYSVSQGDPIMALGSPMGYSDSIAFGVLTSVTNKAATIDTEYTLLSTDILGSTEGSGVLLDLSGEVIGIILQSYSGGSNTVTSVAISEIKTLIETLSNNGELPLIGIKGQDVTDEISEKTGIPKGVYVNEVQVDSPAMLAGIMRGDVIVAVGADTVETMGTYTTAVKKCKAGQQVFVTAMRKGAEGYTEIVFDVTAGAL